jgi:hypothetical protein
LKKFLVIACLVFLACPSLTFASDWRFTGQSKSGNEYYIDIDEMSYDHSDGYQNRKRVIVHERTILTAPQIQHYQDFARKRGAYHSGWDNLRYIITHYQFDLSNKTYAMTYLVFLDSNNNKIAEFKQNNSSFRPVPPDSFDEKTFNLITQNINKVKD